MFVPGEPSRHRAKSGADGRTFSISLDISAVNDPSNVATGR